MNMPKTILFHRQYLGYSGGHGKIWDYFNHIIRSGLYEPKIFFTSNSIFDESNPWLHSRNYVTPEWKPEEADLLFLAGMDWQAIPPELEESIPVINLIQGVRHADPKLPLYNYLRRSAVRICVSQPIADAILATGQINGPLYVIPNGLQIPDEINKFTHKKEHILIGAWKNIPLGTQIAKRAQDMGYMVDLLTRPIPKNIFLEKLKEARIAILLPLPVEGFYLPGLEAMALGTPVIMPDCIGNREYARHAENCLIATPDDIISAIHYFDTPGELLRIQLAGLDTAKHYTMDLEYERFFKVLNSKVLSTPSGKA
jgi:glycosyltransferase involved in cell wall biosynthesis